MRLLAVAVLAVVLALSSAQSCFAVTELYYDDGTAEANTTSGSVGAQFAVRFSLPSDWSAAELVGVRFYIANPGSVIVRIYGSLTTGCNGVELQSFPMTLTNPHFFSDGLGEWNEQMGLTGIRVTGDFCVAAEQTAAMSPAFELDAIDPPRVDPQRSWMYSVITGKWYRLVQPPFEPQITLMIRAEVEQYFPTLAPVGGVVIPANNFAIVAPWLAIIGLVGCIGAVAVVAKKRRA